jgi:uncharacterized protein (DUF2062 family)
MVGIFIGVTPIWGLQTIVAIILSHVLNLNKVLTIVACSLTIPPLIPAIAYVSFLIGGVFIKHNGVILDYSQGITLGNISGGFWQYCLGSILLAFVTAILFGLMTYCLLTIYGKKTV